MASGRIALAVTGLALIGAGPAAGSSNLDQVTGLPIAATSPPAQSQTGKLHPGGSASSCISPKTVPSVDSGGPFNRLDLSYRSNINEPACVTIEYSTADATCRMNGLFSAAYLDQLNPSAIQTGYAGDVGAGPTDATPVNYSVNVPAGSTLFANFNMNTAGVGCAGFDLNVTTDRPWALFKSPIRGHPFVGATLTSTEDVWTGHPSFARQWRRCAADGSACADIPGATSVTYVPVPDDVGHALRVHVSATEGGFTSTSDSDPLPVGVQFDTVNAQSLGAPDPTQNGGLPRVSPTSACGTRKAAPLFTVAGTRFYDVFRRTNESEGTLCTIASISSSSCSTDRVFSAAYLPGFDPATSVRGNYLADSGLSGVFGGDTTTYGFDVPPGAAYDVVVTSAAAGATCATYELRLGSASPYPTGAPSLEGTAQAGQTLTAGDGTWTGAPSSFAYQWQRCFGDGSGCADVPGATGKTLTLGARTVGDTFRVRVTATEGIGSASKTSPVTAAVAEAPPEPPPPGPPAWAGIPLKPVTKTVGKKGGVTLSLLCPAEAVIGCAGTDVVSLGKLGVARKSFAVGPGKTAKVSFTLSKSLRKRLVKRKKLNATQVVNSFDMRGVSARTTAELTLKAPKKKPRG
jgi:hypothetical protein